MVLEGARVLWGKGRGGAALEAKKAENARHGAAIGFILRRHFELSAGQAHLTSSTMACARGKLELAACFSLTTSSRPQPSVIVFLLFFACFPSLKQYLFCAW